MIKQNRNIFIALLTVAQIGHAAAPPSGVTGLLTALYTWIRSQPSGSAPAAAQAAVSTPEADPVDRMRAARLRQARESAIAGLIQAEETDRGTLDVERSNRLNVLARAMREEGRALLVQAETERRTIEAAAALQEQRSRVIERETQARAELENLLETYQVQAADLINRQFIGGLRAVQDRQFHRERAELMQRETAGRGSLVSTQQISYDVFNLQITRLNEAVSFQARAAAILEEATRRSVPERAMAPVYLHNLYHARAHLLQERAVSLQDLEQLNAWIRRAEGNETREVFDALMHDHRYQLPHQGFDQARTRNSVSNEMVTQYIGQIQFLASKGSAEQPTKSSK